MRWVVVGGSGFVGSEVVRAIRASGTPVDVVTAPRLDAVGRTAGDLCTEARRSEVLEELASVLDQAAVVVLAAGAAAPDAADSSSLRGANALLPAVVGLACSVAGVSRLVHLSSAAVQGRTTTLDESTSTRPFSPYSTSKALGEQVLDRLRQELSCEVVVLRATSVQGRGRPTTEAFRRVARSRLASVAGSGDGPSPVGSVEDLAAFVVRLGAWPEPVPPVVLQPWAGLSAAEVLELAGDRAPARLPVALCRSVLTVGFAVSGVAAGRWDGVLRRVETMWFGQAVDDRWARTHDLRGSSTTLPALLAGDRRRRRGARPVPPPSRRGTSTSR